MLSKKQEGSNFMNLTAMEDTYFFFIFLLKKNRNFQGKRGF